MDNDLVEVEQVFAFIDILIEYRAGRIAAALARDEETDNNIVKAEAAQEMIAETIIKMIPESRRSDIETRLNKKYDNLYRSMTFIRKGA